MFDYCVRSLHMSESEADLRIKAARIGREFPSALEMLARGELHMTALRVLAPVLTASNTHLLKEACFKSKREVKELIAKHFPSPDVADSMRRLPQPRSMPTAQEPQPAVPPQLNLMGPLPLARQLASPEQHQSIQTSGVLQLASPQQHQSIQTSGVLQLASPHQPQSVQAYGTPSLDQVPNGDLASIVEQALVLLIAQKKKQRFALTSQPRTQWSPRSGAHSSSKKRDDECVSKGPANGTLNRSREAERSSERREESKSADRPQEARSLAQREENSADSRYIPTALRREVYTLDGGQCSFVSQSGTRCCTRRDLEFHHVVPFARGGAMTLDNLRLMCRAHNALLAERDYGRDYVKSRIAKRQDQTVSDRTTEPGLDRKQP